MKQFFGAFFGSLVGMVLAAVVVAILVVTMLKSTFSSSFKQDDEDNSLPGKEILKITLRGPIEDRERHSPFQQLGDVSPFGGRNGLGLNTALQKLRSAASDKKISGVYLLIEDFEAGFAVLQEFRDALEQFRRSGKYIYAYSENYTQKGYFLASAATKIFLHPQGNLDWRGLSMKLLFFKKTFEKLDLDMQVYKHGRFKSAVEPIVLDKMSQDNRLQTESFLNSIWNNLLLEISEDRKIEVRELNRLADALEIRFAEDAVKAGLADVAAYEDEVVELLKKKIGVSPDKKCRFTDLDDYQGDPDKFTAPRIAVIYAEGGINSGEGNDEEIGSDRLARTIREARLDEKVSAIVLRVNSPGGSALASDVIWREVLLAKKTKPTVVSMGDLAASGGYYISCAAERIFAQPNTITGSIGVFGVIPNAQRMLQNKFGITVDTVNTNRYSDIASGLRSSSAREAEFIQSTVEKVYETFTKRVAEGRNMAQHQVDSIGQGRVWSGAEALGIGLVDELGGLDAALNYVVKKLKLAEYRVVELPRQKNPFNELLGRKQRDFESEYLRDRLGEQVGYLLHLRNLMLMKGPQTRLPFDYVIN